MPTTLYEKVLAVFGMLRNLIDQKTGKIDLAPLFNASVGYPVDSLVVYDNVLYRCTTAHQGDWDVADFAATNIQDVLALKARNTDLAPEYREDGVYGKYQLVVKDGGLVQCTVPGVGANAVFQSISVADLVARINQAIGQCVTLEMIYAVLQNIAALYAVGRGYKIGDICAYKGTLYECVEDVVGEVDYPADTWWNRYWKQTTLDAVLKSKYIAKDSDVLLKTLTVNDSNGKLEITPDTIKVTRHASDPQRVKLAVSKSGTVALLQDLAPNYEDLAAGGNKITFQAGQLVIYGNSLYTCTETHSSDVWVANKWTECTIDAVIEELMDSVSEALHPGLRNQLGNSRFVTSFAIEDSYLDKSSARIFFTPAGLGIDTITSVRIRNCSGNLGSPGTNLYMHICEMDDDAELGETANGTVVAVSGVHDSYMYGVWPALNVSEDYWGILAENLVFANPSKRHFLAFDSVPHDVGTKFGAGGSVVGFKVLAKYRSEESGCFAYLANGDAFELYCPMFSFLWHTAPTRMPLSCCLEEIDGNNRIPSGGEVAVTMPDVASLPDVTEVRLVIAVGPNGPTALSMNTANDVFIAPADIAATWTLLTPQKYNVFTFRSLGRRLVADIASEDASPLVRFKRLWSVDCCAPKAVD